ncbi:MAG: hypothetical protein GF315_10585 [candidate division Zixibacteria bacterium]|nr:hypothetical protein [candidate division Zixibacteria bacterium]
MIYQFEKLNFRQIDSLKRDKTAFFIPISPLEEHGPHLPVGVDAFNADFFARVAAEELQKERQDWDFVIHPLLPVGTQVFKMVGSICLSQSVIRDLITGIGSAIAIYGFKYIVVFSFHGAPGQIVALEEACNKVSKKYNANMISLTSGLAEKFLSGGFRSDFEKEMGREFTDEEKRLFNDDRHAGWWETSMMLKMNPELVSDEYKKLEPILVPFDDLKQASEVLKSRKVGYFGAPHKASAEFADISIRILNKTGLDIINRFLNGEDVSSEVTSKFYKLPWLRTGFKRKVTMSIIVSIKIMVIIYLLRAYFQ